MKDKTFTKIFTHEKMPYLELRYSNNTKHYKKHLHDTLSVGMNIKGKTIYTNKDKKYDFEIGMLALVNPNEIHSCNPIDKIPNLYYMLYLDQKWCYELQKTICKEIIDFVPFEKELITDKRFYDEFKLLCENLFSNVTNEEKEEELIIFFTKLFKTYLKEDYNKLSKNEENIFEKIKIYIQENYKDNISLENLSKTFNLNKFYIIRLFKNNLNISPHSYLINLKINEAKKLLKKGFPLADTALECGFVDQSHFHRNFVKIVATTPKEYQLNFVQD
ncbi:AraC family transcriptional regulator [Halarcobacter mediterraneus]|uniref:AraC family transcriptional regulator n=1 Tax=Halarcobacter mediterraneus TaxID=2023153 RepID=A0A4Q1AYM2_9BACT|nr:AraC family transcriptional regulator [Halarcobacter mediterraneus]RXK12750.1 AraC family transcriptional regulator [Halarcobacter mediterraneus]